MEGEDTIRCEKNNFMGIKAVVPGFSFKDQVSQAVIEQEAVDASALGEGKRLD